METQIDAESSQAELQELETVLSSDTFKRAPTLARILEYLCKSYFRGEHFVKEYEIATQVMGRSNDFDPQQDGSVRVNLHHLRKKLKQFYETEGEHHSIWITLPIGQSLPTFIVRSPAHNPKDATNITESQREESAATPATPSNSPFAAVESVELSAPGRIRSQSRYLRYLTVLLPVLLGAALMWSAGWAWLHRGQTEASGGVITDATIRVGCGLQRPYRDQAGRTWNPDASFKGGYGFYRKVGSIIGTADATIFEYGREGSFSYDIPLPAASYEVHLYFAETMVHGEGNRVMKISMNGQQTEAFLDVTSDSGGFSTATEKLYTGVRPAADGKLHLQFQSASGAPAFVNAIEILPANGAAMRPIRQTTLTTYYFDPQGIVWMPDAWFRGGRTTQLTEAFPKVELNGIYQSERFGNFSYAIPVLPDRTYKITLYFQDVWFSHQARDFTGGRREFDVSCNGKELLQHFDPMHERDADGFRVTRQFSGVQPTTQGKLLLTFTPSQNYATINAIVIEDETAHASAAL